MPSQTNLSFGFRRLEIMCRSRMEYDTFHGAIFGIIELDRIRSSFKKKKNSQLFSIKCMGLLTF